MNRIIATLAPILALAADAAAQSTITYGVFINHGETTTWTAPWDKSHNTDEGHKTGITVGFDVTLLDWADFATFVATDGVIGFGPRLRPGTYRHFSPFVDAMIVNLHSTLQIVDG